MSKDTGYLELPRGQQGGQCGQALVEQRIDLLFIALLVVGQQGGELGAPLLPDSQLRQKLQGEFIAHLVGLKD